MSLCKCRDGKYRSWELEKEGEEGKNFGQSTHTQRSSQSHIVPCTCMHWRNLEGKLWNPLPLPFLCCSRALVQMRPKVQFLKTEGICSFKLTRIELYLKYTNNDITGTTLECPDDSCILRHKNLVFVVALLFLGSSGMVARMQNGRVTSVLEFLFYVPNLLVSFPSLLLQNYKPRQWAYQLGNISSRTITDVKQCWACLVLAWETECCC